VPGRRLDDRLAEDLLGEGAHQPVHLREGEELARPEEPADRMRPADQRLDAHGDAGDDVELRLVVQHQLTLGQSGPQLLDEGEVAAAVGMP
jgi:hypothetical protein